MRRDGGYDADAHRGATVNAFVRPVQAASGLAATQLEDQQERCNAAFESARQHRQGSNMLLVRLSPRADQTCLRLRGGGGDGGATGAESRSSYLEMYKTQKPGELDAREEQLAVWTCCRLTRQQLGGEDGKAAVAMCQLGYLYNREPLLQSLKEHLVDGVPMPPLAKHVVSLKDLTTLQLAPSSSEAAAAPAVAASTGDFRAATHVRYACPLTGLELNGRFKFVALRPSGVVVSERALKQAPAAVEELLGGPALVTQAVVVLNGTAEEVEALRLAHAAAKASKKKKRNVEAADRSVLQPAAVEDKQRVTGASNPAKEDVSKRYKATEHLPAGATPEVWSSLFTSAAPQRTETFGARSLSFRR